MFYSPIIFINLYRKSDYTPKRAKQSSLRVNTRKEAQNARNLCRTCTGSVWERRIKHIGRTSTGTFYTVSDVRICKYHGQILRGQGITEYSINIFPPVIITHRKCRKHFKTSFYESLKSLDGLLKKSHQKILKTSSRKSILKKWTNNIKSN